MTEKDMEDVLEIRLSLEGLAVVFPVKDHTGSIAGTESSHGRF